MRVPRQRAQISTLAKRVVQQNNYAGMGGHLCGKFPRERRIWRHHHLGGVEERQAALVLAVGVASAQEEEYGDVKRLVANGILDHVQFAQLHPRPWTGDPAQKWPNRTHKSPLNQHRELQTRRAQLASPVTIPGKNIEHLLPPVAQNIVPHLGVAVARYAVEQSFLIAASAPPRSWAVVNLRVGTQSPQAHVRQGVARSDASSRGCYASHSTALYMNTSATSSS
jgi:hypothetical protein